MRALLTGYADIVHNMKLLHFSNEGSATEFIRSGAVELVEVQSEAEVTQFLFRVSCQLVHKVNNLVL